MFSPIALKYFKQKKINALIGNSTDLNTILQFEKILGNFGVCSVNIKNNTAIFFKDIPIYYRGNTFIKYLKKIPNILILGTFVRYETSLINLIIKKISNKFITNFFQIGAFNDYTFPIKLISTTIKGTLHLFFGLTGINKIYLSKKQFLLFADWNSSFIVSKNNFTHIFQTLMRKFFSFSSQVNNFVFLNYNVSLLNRLEFFLHANTKANIVIPKKENKIQKNTRLFLLNTLPTKKQSKQKDIILFSTHLTTLTTNTQNIIELPINSWFEKNGFSMNIEGKIQQKHKVVSTPENTIKHFDKIAEALFCLKDEELCQQDFDNKTAFRWYVMFLKQNFFFNFFHFNLNKQLFAFFFLFTKPIFFSKNYRLMAYSTKIKNFYKTDLLSENSYNMSLASFFNINNKNLPF